MWAGSNRAKEKEVSDKEIKKRREKMEKVGNYLFAASLAAVASGYIAVMTMALA